MSKRSPKSPRSSAQAVPSLPLRVLSSLPWLSPVWFWSLAMGVAALALGGFTVMLNSDLWFHLAAGRLILENGSVPLTDTWSFTAAGQPWHNHEWLSGVIFHSWAKAFGTDTLVYWQWALTVATFLVLFRALSRLSGSFPWSFLLAAFAIVVAAPFFDTRLHLYSLLFFTVLLHQILLRPSPSNALPLLFVLWINLHGGAIFGLMVLTLGLASSALFSEPGEAPGWEGRKARLPKLGGLWVACILACLVNPFGVGALTYPFKLALEADSPTRTTLYEWLPPFLPGGIQSPFYPWSIGLFALGGLTLLWSGPLGERKRIAWLSLALGALTLAMSLQSRRFIPLFAISQTVVLCLAGARLLEWPPLRRLAPRRPLQIAMALLALTAGLVKLAQYPLTPHAFPLLTQLEKMPVDVLNFTDVNRIEGKVFSYFLWAGYVDYRTAGRLQVYIDPRSETVFDPQTQSRYYQIQAQKPGWEEALEASGAEYVVWPFHQERWRAFITTLVSSGRWRFLYGDSLSVLLVRSDVQSPRSLVETPPSAHRSLALAKRDINRNNLASAERFLRDALDRMPALPDACVDLVRVQVALAKLDDARGTAMDCRRRMLDDRGQRILSELLIKGRAGV